MERKVLVAEREPVFATERANGLERLPRLIGATPAAPLVGETRERVEDRVEVR